MLEEMSLLMRSCAAPLKGDGDHSLGCCAVFQRGLIKHTRMSIGQVWLYECAQLDPDPFLRHIVGYNLVTLAQCATFPGGCHRSVLHFVWTLSGPLWSLVSCWPQEESSEDPRRRTDSTVGTGETNGSPDPGGHGALCGVSRCSPWFPTRRCSAGHSADFMYSSSFSPEDTIPKKVVCHFSGKAYADEERWDIDSCTHCYCLQGQTLCSTVSCPPLPCAQPIKVEGSCCPMCPGI